MPTPKIFESEYRFCLILWENEPMSSAELAKICKEKLLWSRTTTYTVIKRLCDKGYLKNENAVVSSLVNRQTVQEADGQEVLQRSFNGSLPQFFAAFLRAGSVSEKDAEEIEALIEAYRAGR